METIELEEARDDNDLDELFKVLNMSSLVSNFNWGLVRRGRKSRETSIAYRTTTEARESALWRKSERKRFRRAVDRRRRRKN